MNHDSLIHARAAADPHQPAAAEVIRWETLKALAVLLIGTAAMAALILTVAHFIK
jgi:hypothetical protein